MNTLPEIRTRIEEIDRDIVELLHERVVLAHEAGRLKKEQNRLILDPAREADVIANAVTRARDLGVDDENVREIFWRIVGMCRDAQAGRT